MKKLPVPLQVIAQALSDWWDDWISMILIGLVWMLCWLTIVLGPPATLGLYYVTNELAHGRSLGLSGLLEGGRRYFFKSWLWTLLNLVVMIVVWSNLWFYGQVEAAWVGIVQSFFMVVCLVWLVTQFYALPFLMEQEQKHLRWALRNGLFTMLASPGYTLVVVGLAVVIGVLSVVLVIPLFLGGPCLITAMGNRAVIERVETYGVREREAPQGEPRSDEW